MKRLTLGGALAALALFPAGALAGTPRATVFSVDQHRRTMQIIDAHHVVHAYRYRGRLPRVSLGDRISFRRSGQTISRVARTSLSAGRVSFYAQVVRDSSRHVQLRLADGNTFNLSARQVTAARVSHAAAVARDALTSTASAPVTVMIQGLTPGTTVLISESVNAQGHWTVMITLPPSATSTGTVGLGDDPSADDQVAEGRIVQVSTSSLAIDTGSRELTVSVDPSSGLTDGFAVGDVVDVTYAQNPDGSLSADDVEYAEEDASGVVTAVSEGRLTLDDGAGGPSETISADPALGLFTGVAPGDQVDVTYHQSSAGAVADAIDDRTWDN